VDADLRPIQDQQALRRHRGLQVQVRVWFRVWVGIRSCASGAVPNVPTGIAVVLGSAGKPLEPTSAASAASGTGDAQVADVSASVRSVSRGVIYTRPGPAFRVRVRVRVASAHTVPADEASGS